MSEQIILSSAPVPGAPTPPLELWPEAWPEWSRQYEETAKRMHEAGDFTAADDIATLVMGLVEYEREALEYEREAKRARAKGDVTPECDGSVYCQAPVHILGCFAGPAEQTQEETAQEVSSRRGWRSFLRLLRRAPLSPAPRRVRLRRESYDDWMLESGAATMRWVADRLESGAAGCKPWTKAEAARVLRRDADVLTGAERSPSAERTQ